MVAPDDTITEIENLFGLSADQKSIKGSLVGDRYAILELMLEFAKRYNIKPMIEEYTLDLDGLHAAIARSEKKNQSRY